jgi:hypothetical protein
MYKIIGADQREYGPIGLDQIRQWISEGRINGQTKVQAEGSTDWKSAADVPELAALLPARPAPIVMSAPPAAATNPLAIWALVTGIGSVVLCCCGLLAPVSIVLGAVALAQIKRNPNQRGRGFAIAGLVLGCIALLFSIIGLIAMILSPNFSDNLRNAINLDWKFH